MKKLNCLFWLSVISMLLPLVSEAQWSSQPLLLTPGWNAVFLEVQPEPSDADSVFLGLPIESVWMWDRKSTSIQFIDDVNGLVPSQPDWLTYFPANSPNRALGNMHSVRAGKGMLIKVNSSTNVQLTVTGKPVLPRGEWIANMQNLAGFFVRSNQTTFREYLSGSSAHEGQVIRTLQQNGQWVSIPETSVIQRGKSYWLQTRGASDYAGPIRLTLERRAGIDFGSILNEASLNLRNESTNQSRVVSLSLLPSVGKPVGASNSPALAGMVKLRYFNIEVTNSTNVTFEWRPLTNLTLTVSNGSEITLRLGIERASFDASGAVTGEPATYQSLLQVSDGSGYRVIVPVSAEGLNSIGRAGSRGKAAVTDSLEAARVGLWVGTVNLTNVSWVGALSTNLVQTNGTFNLTNKSTPRPTASEFLFRILVHFDTNGNAKLLQKVKTDN